MFLICKTDMNTTKQYLKELDFLKGILIILVVSFHLVFIGNTYPYAKQVVYTFHMPCFLIISGYLMNINKSPLQFFNTIKRFIIPYFIIESGYIVMASILPIREHIDNLTVSEFINKLLLHPLGPYWYLQTLTICGISYYIIFNYIKSTIASRFIILGILFFIYTEVFNIMSFSSTIFFMTGAIINKCEIKFIDIFKASPFAIIAFALLVYFPENANRQTLGGILIIYAAISSMLYFYKKVTGHTSKLILYLGRNSLLIFLFSPIFTILCKFMLPYLLWDKTGITYLIISLIFCISGSILIGYILDKCKISRFIIGKSSALSPN